MDPQQRSVLRARASIIKALAHPTRLLIVEALARREHCVAELTEMAEADMSTVSRHLSILKESGIVDGEKRGAQVHYSLRVPCILSFFGCVEAVLRSSADDRREVARACGTGAAAAAGPRASAPRAPASRAARRAAAGRSAARAGGR